MNDSNSKEHAAAAVSSNNDTPIIENVLNNRKPPTVPTKTPATTTTATTTTTTNSEDEKNLNTLVGMGYSADHATQALQASRWNFSRAISFLLSRDDSQLSIGNLNLQEEKDKKNDSNSFVSVGTSTPLAAISNESTADSLAAQSYNELLLMGYSETQIQQALSKANGDVTQAICCLMEEPKTNLDENTTTTPTPTIVNDIPNDQPLKTVANAAEGKNGNDDDDDDEDNAYKEILQLGYTKAQAQQAMEIANGDVTKAVLFLMGESRLQVNGPDAASPTAAAANGQSSNGADGGEDFEDRKPAAKPKAPGAVSVPNYEGIVQMGYTKEQAIQAMNAANGDINRAVFFLMGDDNRANSMGRLLPNSDDIEHSGNPILNSLGNNSVDTMAESQSKPGAVSVSNYDGILQMGYSETEAIQAMAACGGNVTQAIYYLMGESRLIFDRSGGDNNNRNNNTNNNASVTSHPASHSENGPSEGGDTLDSKIAATCMDLVGSNSALLSGNHSGSDINKSIYDEILQMGYSKAQVDQAMRVAAGDVTQAINYLLMGDSRSGFNASLQDERSLGFDANDFFEITANSDAPLERNLLQEMQEHQLQLQALYNGSAYQQADPRSPNAPTTLTNQLNTAPRRPNSTTPGRQSDSLRMVATTKSLTRIPHGKEATAFCSVVAASKFLHDGGVVNSEFLAKTIDNGSQLQQELQEQNPRGDQQKSSNRRQRQGQQQPLSFFANRNRNRNRDRNGDSVGDNDSGAVAEHRVYTWRVQDVLSRLGSKLGLEPTREPKSGENANDGTRRGASTGGRSRNQANTVVMESRKGKFDHTIVRADKSKPSTKQTVPPPSGIRQLLASCRNEQQTGISWQLFLLEIVVQTRISEPTYKLCAETSYDAMCVCMPPKGSAHKFWLFDFKPRAPFRVPGAYARVHANMMQLVESLETLLAMIASQELTDHEDAPIDARCLNVISFELHPVSALPRSSVKKAS